MAMVEPKNALIHNIELAIEHRLQALSALGLLEAQTIPVFEEATQTAAHLLEAPICILGFLEQNSYSFKSAVGLSLLGLMNQLAQERQLPSHEAFCTQVVETGQVLVVGDTLAEPKFANSNLVKRYGIRAYLGVPLYDSVGNCLGAITVIDLQPRTFTSKHLKLLELMARWSMSEFELNQVPKEQVNQMWENQIGVTPTYPITSSQPAVISSSALPFSTLSSIPVALPITQIKIHLLEQLTQELRTPLTSILGMANVVSREIYGPLTNKQKEYLEIIQNSGRYLLSLVNEVTQLGKLDECEQALNLVPVDIEMLCQQVLNTLEEAAKRREQQIRLSLEPGKSRIWFLDKEKVRQLIYHLLSSMVQAATSGSTIRLHISQKAKFLNITVSVSHPWLGEGLVPVTFDCNKQSTLPTVSSCLDNNGSGKDNGLLHLKSDSSLDSLTVVPNAEVSQLNNSGSYESLRLLLSYDLAELHGGKIELLGTSELGYRYVVSLPDLASVEENV